MTRGGDRIRASSGRTGHPSAEDLASLVDGLADEEGTRRLTEHLAACPACREAWSDTARVRIEACRDPEGFRADVRLAEAHRLVGAPAHRGAGSRAALQRRWLLPAGLLTGLAVVIAAGTQLRADGAWDRTVSPVRAAMQAPGGWWFPDAPPAPASAGSVRRSARHGGGDSLDRAVRTLLAAYEAGDRSDETLYWLAAGMLLAGDLRSARDLVDDARGRWADQTRFAVLDAILLHRENRPDRAVEALRTVPRSDPLGDLARHNLRLMGAVRQLEQPLAPILLD